MSDAWDESFDTWSGEDVLAEAGREQLLELARKLARRRDAERAEAQAEIAQLKQALRERAELVAARERELDERERLLRPVETGGPPAPRRRRSLRVRRDPESAEPPAGRGPDLEGQARELALRAAAIGELEQELRQREQRLEQETAAVPPRQGGTRPEAAAPAATARERELEDRLSAIEAREQQAATAIAGREDEVAARAAALDEREEALLAQASVLEARAAGFAAGAASRGPSGAGQGTEPSDRSPGQDEQGPELARREARIAARERELALIRQGLDAARNALLAREREHRRREAEEARRAFTPPLAPLGFSEGFAAFAATRGRRVE